MTFRTALAGVAVRDLTAASLWYQKFLGREPDRRPLPRVVEWSFPAGGGLQLFEDAERAGSSSVTLSMQEFDEHLTLLRRNGIVVEEQTHSPKLQTATLHDPDGNRVVMAELRVAEPA